MTAARALELRVSPIHGLGVFAARPIRAGTRLVEYTGQRIGHARADDRAAADPAAGTHTFLFTVNARLVIDASRGGNIARFLNHSCTPNCESVTEGNRVFIEALRDLRPGEELAYDYHLTFLGEMERNWRKLYACNCGTPQCRGTLLDLEGKRARPRTGSAGAAAAPAERRGGPRFPGEFAALLNGRGLRILADSRAGTSLHGRGAPPVLAFPGLLAPRALAACLPLLETRLLVHTRALRVPLPPPRPGRGRKGGGRLPGTHQVRGAELNGHASPAARAAEEIGLRTMLGSPSFRYFAEAVSGFPLRNGWEQRVLCFEPGGYVGPGAEPFPSRGARHRTGTVELQVSLGTAGVQAQWLVYEQGGYLSGALPLGRQPGIVASRNPAWQYITPLVPRPGRARDARRWALVGRFEIAED